MEALDSEVPWSFRNASGHTYLRKDSATRLLAPWARASLVATQSGDAVLVELPGELLAHDVVLSDQRAHAEPHLITAIEVGTLSDAGAGARSPYRGSATLEGARHYALFPALLGGSLVKPLAAARGGWRVPPKVVATLAVEIAAGLADSEDVGLLKPESVVVSTSGRAQVRGALLELLAGRIEALAPMARPRLAYFAPELVRAGSGAKMDARGRLFALGIMLSELVSGRALLPEHPSAARLLADWSFSIPELPADAPSELRAAIWALLQRDPDRRARPTMLIELLSPLYEPGMDVAAALGISFGQHAPYL